MDTQNCLFRVGSYSYDSTKMVFTTGSFGYSSKDTNGIALDYDISKFKIEIPTSGAYTLLRQNCTYMGWKEFWRKELTLE